MFYRRNIDEETASSFIDSLVSFFADTGEVLGSADLMRARNAIRYGNMATYHDSMGQICGYLEWAGVCAESFSRFLKSAEYPRYSYEANEGKLIIITRFRALSFSKPVRLGVLSALSSYRLVAFVHNNKLVLYRRTGAGFKRICRREFD
jgi:hypothetical protein